MQRKSGKAKTFFPSAALLLQVRGEIRSPPFLLSSRKQFSTYSRLAGCVCTVLGGRVEYIMVLRERRGGPPRTTHIFVLLSRSADSSLLLSSSFVEKRKGRGKPNQDRGRKEVDWCQERHPNWKCSGDEGKETLFYYGREEVKVSQVLLLFPSVPPVPFVRCDNPKAISHPHCGGEGEREKKSWWCAFLPPPPIPGPPFLMVP